MHAFAFVDASGKKQWGKWTFEPVAGTQALSDDEAKAKGPDFLIDELRQRVAITYNPRVLPKGVEPSSDPMLAARAAPYAVSLGRRLGEGAKQ